jgi:hypothetical protein
LHHDGPVHKQSAKYIPTSRETLSSCASRSSCCIGVKPTRLSTGCGWGHLMITRIDRTSIQDLMSAWLCVARLLPRGSRALGSSSTFLFPRHEKPRRHISFCHTLVTSFAFTCRRIASFRLVSVPELISPLLIFVCCPSLTLFARRHAQDVP